MTKTDFFAEAEKAFNANSTAAYMNANRTVNPDQFKAFLEVMWGIKSITDKLGVKENLVKELARRHFASKQDEVDFILTFLA